MPQDRVDFVVPVPALAEHVVPERAFVTNASLLHHALRSGVLGDSTGFDPVERELLEPELDGRPHGLGYQAAPPVFTSDGVAE